MRTKLTSPREGWTKRIGKNLVHLNWSHDWDGWGTSHDDGRITWHFLNIEPFGAPYGWGISLIFWRLLIRLGRVT